MLGFRSSKIGKDCLLANCFALVHYSDPFINKDVAIGEFVEGVELLVTISGCIKNPIYTILVDDLPLPEFLPV